jgi:hypothetical protein
MTMSKAIIKDNIKKKSGFVPVSGSSSLFGIGSSTLVVSAAVTAVSDGVSATSAVVALGFGGALNTTIDALSGSGARNSERASVHSVMATHLSESALITGIV